MKYYLFAGERSGDLHASNLMQAIRKKDPDAIFRGFGGDMMKSSGLDLSMHYREFSAMGFWEVLIGLRKFTKLLDYCQNEILEFRPDVLILIDFSGFNMRLAKRMATLKIPVHYYIAPKVWAWNTGRAKKIKKYVDKLYCILPFETEFFSRFGIDAFYVGNPLVSHIEAEKKQIPEYGRKYIAILPGSRKQEVTKILTTVLLVTRKFKNERFIVAGVDNLPESIYQECRNSANVEVWYNKTYELLFNSKAAIVTSGTATLETALFNVPQMVVYRTSLISYAIGKMLIKIPFISLVNLIINKPLVAEFIQNDCNEINLNNELHSILNNIEKKQALEVGYDQIKKLLSNKNASEETAELILKSLN